MPVRGRDRRMLDQVDGGDPDKQQNNRNLHDHDARIEIGGLLDADDQHGRDHADGQKRHQVEVRLVDRQSGNVHTRRAAS